MYTYPGDPEEEIEFAGYCQQQDQQRKVSVGRVCDEVNGSATCPMRGHNQAIEQAQPRDLYAVRFSDAVEDGGDFFHRTLPLPKATRSPKQATASKSEINSSTVAVAQMSME
jgi:hypothetical protein